MKKSMMPFERCIPEWSKFIKASPEAIIVPCNTVYLRYDKYIQIENHYKALLVFASHVMEKNPNELSFGDLKNFCLRDYLQHKGMLENLYFPVDWYLTKIRELEKEIEKLKKEKKNENPA